MPRGDGTGPRGMGTMTGRGAGYCVGFVASGYTNPIVEGGIGMGFGRGRGFGGGGRGWRNRFHAMGAPGRMQFAGYPAPYGEPDPETEKQAMKNHADALQSELDLIKKRLADVESATAAK